MRFLKLSSLVAIAALTLALGAASASASGFMAEEFPTTYKGTQTGYVMLVTSGGTTACTGMNAVAEGTGPTANLGPIYVSDGSCKKSNSTAMKMNGCKFTFHTGAELEKGKFAGTVEIGPAGCGPISTSTLSCTTTVPAQSGLAATFQNTGSGATAGVTVALNASKVKYTLSSGCAVAAGTYENGSLSGNWELSGSTELEPQGVRVGGSVGLFASGENLAAGTYPAGVLGTQSVAQKFETSSGTVKCETANLSGGLLTGSANSIALEPEYLKCKAFGLSAVIKTNGCQYVTSLSAVILSCPAGEELEVDAGGGSCLVTIPPNQTLATVAYEVVGTGTARKIVASFNDANFEYTNVGAGCTGPGSHNDGGLTGSTILEAIS